MTQHQETGTRVFTVSLLLNKKGKEGGRQGKKAGRRKGKRGRKEDTNNPATGEWIHNGILLKRNCI